MNIDPDNVDRVQEQESEKKRGLFSKLFSKKTEQTNPMTEMADEIEQTMEQEEDQQREEELHRSHQDAGLLATIEQLKAQISALGEFRKTTNERFLHVSEEIGQLRESILSREKEISELTVRVSRAIDMVEEVHPEKLEELSNKQTSEMTKLATKIESNRVMGENILTQLKDIRDKVSIFNDVEDIIKLDKQITDKLMTIERLETVVDQHSNKVEKFFIKIEQQYQEFERFEHDRKELEQSHHTLIKEFDSLKAKVGDVATIKDLSKMEEDMQDINQINLDSINVLKKQLAVLEESLDVMKQSESQEQKEVLEGTIKDLEARLTTLQSHIQHHADQLEEHHKHLGAHEEKLAQHHNDISQLHESLPKFNDIHMSNNQLHKQLEQLELQVTTVRDSVRLHNQKLQTHDKHIDHLHNKTDNFSSMKKPFGEPFDKLILQTHLALEAGSIKLAEKLYNTLRIAYLELPDKVKSKELQLVIRSIYEIIITERARKPKIVHKKHHKKKVLH